MRSWRRSRGFQLLSFSLAAMMAAGLGCGDRGGSGDSADGHSGRARSALEGAPPSAPSGEAADEQQGGHANPPTNAGAFVQKIPIEVPPGIGNMTPQISIAYSSHGGLGIAGMGWDLPIAMITLNQADGMRPAKVEDDIMRYPVRTPVERYSSNFGTLAQLREPGSYATAPKTYLFTAHNDARVMAIQDDSGQPDYGGDKAAWQVTMKDGTTYRYGYTDDSSVWRDKGHDSEAKVAWLLDQVEDRHGNRMHYYYEEYPGGQDELRQPVLRAIEYGVPASNQSTSSRLVVQFDYIESPDWKKSSYTLGTETDFAYLLDRVCVFARTQVLAGTTPGGHRTWEVPGGDVPEPTDNFTKLNCWELTYQFENAAYADGYSRRPLLMQVQRVARDGTALPPWKFTYTHQNTLWSGVYQSSVDAGGVEWDVPDQMSLEKATLDVEHQMIDLNGDGLADIMKGAPDGTFPVSLARLDDGAGLHYEEQTSWANPLAVYASPVELVVTPGNSSTDSSDSDVWHHFDATMSWEVGAGLGYAQSMTGAPAVMLDAVSGLPGTDSEWDEAEDEHLPLGYFQFLHSSFIGPPPSVGMRNVFNRADTIDQLETYGSYKDRVSKEAAFDLRASDGQDDGDRIEIDHCFNTAAGPKNGALGADLDCFDSSGPRWFAAAQVSDGEERGFSAETWTQQDMDGDGLVDLVFAAPVMVRSANGAVRDFEKGANDWFISRGTGSGFAAPVPWVVPKKIIGIPEAGMAHGTAMLGVSVSDSELRANRVFGGGLMLNYGATGWSLSPSIITPNGAVGLPAINGPIDPTSYALGAAQSVATSAAYNAVAANLNQRAMSAAAQSMRAVNTATNPIDQLYPSVGAGMNVTNKGAYYVFDLWLLGDLAVKFFEHPVVSHSYGYQGMMDMTGDGRPDLVSSRFETLIGTLNAPSRWLLYRNNGSGFETPEVIRFVESPVTAVGAGTSMNAMSRSTTSNYTDRLSWVPFGWDTFPIGVYEQDWGLSDLNADGYPDLVDSTNQSCDGEVCWTVYYNLGREFTEGIKWKFRGDWQTQHGSSCTSVLGFPRLMRSAYGQTSDGGGEGSIVHSRQVQGLADVNGDGLPDFVYEQPAPVADSSGECDYINPSSNFQDAEDIIDRVTPYRLHRKLLVRLNTGNGFGVPIDWVDTDGFALGGAAVIGAGGDSPLYSKSYTALGTGDFNADGAPDLSVRFDGDWQADSVIPEKKRLYKLGEANVDVLATATMPEGGRIEVSYRYERPSPHMAGGHWVVESVRTVDLDDTRLDVTRFYYYEGGKYDRERRMFQGFERVYQVTEDVAGYESSGYTLSRYYQTPGFEGQLYCRAVRRLANAREAVEGLVASHRAEWDATPLGGSRPGWTAPVAIGDAEHAGALAGPQPLPRDSSDLAGGPDAPEGDPGSYGPPPSGDPGNDPAEEEAEEERDEVDEATDPEPEEPVWPDTTPLDASSAPGALPTDVQIFSDGFTWTRDDNATNPPWWDWPVYSDDCEPGETGSASFLCEPEEIVLTDLACGDVDDPGVRVEEEFSIAADLSTLVGVHTVRPMVTATHTYDRNGGNPLIIAAENEYDGNGNVITVRDAGDITTADDDLVTETEFMARNELLHVLDKPCTVTVEGAGGQNLSTTRYAYDGASSFACSAEVDVGDATSIQRVVDSGHAVTDGYQYTPEGLVFVHTDPRLNDTTTTYEPDMPWFPIRVERTVFNASGPTTIATETRWLGVNEGALIHFGVVGVEVDANDDETKHTYDAFDRPLKLVRPGDTMGAPTESWSYHDWNGNGNDRRRVAHTRRFSASLSVTTTTTYDGFGQVQKMEGPPPDNLAGCGSGCVAVAREVTYDADGREVVSVHPYFSNAAAGADLTATTYDLLGRVTQVTGPDLVARTTAYDRDLTTVVDPDGLVTVTRTNARGKPTGVYRYTGGGATLYSATESTYRPDGHLEGILDDAGNQWSFDHDQLGRQISASDPNTGVRNTTYDDSGNVAIVTDGRYATIGMAMGTLHDALNRPTVREVRVNTTVTGTTLSGGTPLQRTFYWYDVDPAIFPDAEMSCPENHLGRLSRVVQWQDVGGGMEEVSRKEYCYDDRGRVGKMAHVISGQPYLYLFTYGSADQVLTTMYPDEDVVTSEYDASGRVVRVRNLAGPLVAASHARADGLPMRRDLGDGAARQRYCYADGPTGAVLSRMVVGDASMNYGCGNAAPPAAGSIYDVSFTRTLGGRIETRSETFVRPGSGAETHTATYDYDELMRLEKETYDTVETDFDYDTLDNLTGIGGVQQTFGSSGRAVRGAGPNAILNGVGGRAFAYDAVGNALSMAQGGSNTLFVRGFDGQPLNITRGTNPNDWSMYHYDETGQRVLAAKGGVGTIYSGAFHDSFTRKETFYQGIGVKVDDTPYFTVSDPAGSTSLMLDADGNVVQYTSYEPYGGIRANEQFDPDPADGLTPYATDYLFGGKERDKTFAADDDIYDYGPRMYFADVGTWLTPDPTYNDGLNRYTFVHGDPINRADPTGRTGEELLWLAWEVFGPGPEDAALWAAGAAFSQADSAAPGPADAAAATGVIYGTVGIRSYRVASRVYKHWDKIEDLIEMGADAGIYVARGARPIFNEYVGKSSNLAARFSDLAHKKLRQLLGQPTSQLDFGVIDLEKIAMEYPGATRGEVLRMLDIFEQARLDAVPMAKRALNSVNPISERNLPAFADYFKHPMEYYYKYKTPGFDDL